MGEGDTTLCGRTYLVRVHLEFAHDLDRDFTGIALQVARAVDVAEGAIAHLLQQLPPFQARVSGQLPLALVLLGDHPGQVLVLDLLALCARLLLVRAGLLLGAGGVRGDVPGLGPPIPRVGAVGDRVCVGVGYLAGGHLIGIGQGVLVLPMLVDIHGRDLSRGVVLVR